MTDDTPEKDLKNKPPDAPLGAAPDKPLAPSEPAPVAAPPPPVAVAPPAGAAGAATPPAKPAAAAPAAAAQPAAPAAPKEAPPKPVPLENEFVTKLKARFGDAIREAWIDRKQSILVVDSKDLLSLARYFR